LGLIFAGILAFYFYPEKLKTLYGKVLLHLHLGKKNELHTSKIPSNSNVASLLGTLESSFQI